MLINNTELLIELEELFKKEPFNYESGTVVLHVNRGSIQFIESLKELDKLEE